MLINILSTPHLIVELTQSTKLTQSETNNKDVNFERQKTTRKSQNAAWQSATDEIFSGLAMVLECQPSHFSAHLVASRIRPLFRR